MKFKVIVYHTPENPKAYGAKAEKNELEVEAESISDAIRQCTKKETVRIVVIPK